MAKHIGIVACSAEGAALCYRTICEEGSRYMGQHMHPEVTMHTHSLGEYMRRIYENRWDLVAELMLSSAEKLAAAGAEFLICPDNTLHQVFDLVTPRCPLPWLHIADVVASEALHQGFSCLAVLGTKFLMEGPVYPQQLKKRNIAYKMPEPAQRQEMNRIIFEELVNGRFLPESLDYCVSIITEMKSLGCDAAVLGCTEIPLLVPPERSPLPVLDSTRLLARASLKYSIE